MNPAPSVNDLSQFEGLEYLRTLGAGARSKVYLAEDNGREVAVKVYARSAIERMQRKLGQNIAEFEYARNRELYSIEGMRRYVAEPLRTIHTEGRSAFVQEHIDGDVWFFHVRRHADCDIPGLHEHLKTIIECAHAGGYFDLDLHSLNVLVAKDESGEYVPKLVDFNLIPFHMRPPNPFAALALRLGILTPASRDWKKLDCFEDVSKGHVKILRNMTPRA